MLAVKSESGVSEVVYSVVTEDERLLVLGGRGVCFLLQDDFYLVNWISAGFTPHIQINILINK
jgi:hypothetical protein